MFEPEWKEVNAFTNRNTGITVVVRKSNHATARYSIEVGFIVGDEGKDRTLSRSAPQRPNR